MQTFTPPAVAAAGWKSAWRGWRDNPLGPAWTAAEGQRLVRTHWLRRSPGLLIFGTLLSLAVTAANVALLFDTLRYMQHAGSRPFIAANASLGIGVTLLGAFLFSLGWLLARLYGVLQFALGFLEHAPRQRFRQTLDDMLAVTSLSEQELLVGVLRFGLGRLLMPLLLTCASASVLVARIVPRDSGMEYGGWSIASAALLAGLMLFISGLLVSSALLFTATAVSLTEQASVWPSVGAATLIGSQVLFGAGSLWITLSNEKPVGDQGVFIAAAAILLLVIGLLLYLARRSESLRRGLAGALPLMVLAPYMLVAGSLAVTYEFDSPEVVLGWLLQPLELLTVVNPVLIGQFFMESGEGYAGASLWALGNIYHGSLGALVHWATILPLQIAFVAMAAEFARDAIRRRKWGQAG